MSSPAQPGQNPEKKHGQLTIYAGYSTGTGKSYAMLKAGEAARRAGAEVVVGLADCRPWPETAALAEGFEQLPCRKVWQNGRMEAELDLDACLKRRPQKILIDDLSHLNGAGSRHMKRYQDIDELLKAGVDVCTTLDVQHLESLQDMVASVLGGSEAERIPDSVFDQAAQVEFVDIEPERLMQRLQEDPERGELPSLTQLSALREIGLRRCADRVARHAHGSHSRGQYRVQEHILVCLSSAPSNPRIIRTAARMAGAFRCRFTALFVENKDFARMSEENRERLRANIHLAQQLGASIETVYGEDTALQIAEFSRLSGVTKIVLGRSGPPRRLRFQTLPLTDRLIELAPELDIHIIPDNRISRRFSEGRREPAGILPLSVQDLAKSGGILALITLVGMMFSYAGFPKANLITLYILGAVLVSMATQSPLCSLIASAFSVLIFNFFFTAPQFSLHAYNREDSITFLVMFLASFLTGSLASRLKSHAAHTAQAARRTKLLFETSQTLQKAHTQAEILSVTARQLLKIFQRDIVAYLVRNETLQQPEVFLADSSLSAERYTSPKEQEVARWVLNNNKRAGAGTETLSDACCTYLSVRTGEKVYGVVGIAAGQPQDTFENGILLSVLGECALAMENQNNLEEKEAAAIRAKNEQLRADLLRSISHDLRTPLTSISGNASNLLTNGELFDQKTKQQMYADIYDDSMWLIDLVENLLSVSRLEEGRMNLHISTELIDDVVAEALRHVHRKSAEYHIRVEPGEEYLLAQIDARLIVQVIINIVDNAIKYTPPGSEIRISWEKQGNFVQIAIADNGPGIPKQDQPHIFEMFYSAAHQSADGRRSLGLGLALCRSIVNAHGGEIAVSDRQPHGAVFTFTVPAGEVELHE